MLVINLKFYFNQFIFILKRHINYVRSVEFIGITLVIIFNSSNCQLRGQMILHAPFNRVLLRQASKNPKVFGGRAFVKMSTYCPLSGICLTTMSPFWTFSRTKWIENPRQRSLTCYTQLVSLRWTYVAPRLSERINIGFSTSTPSSDSVARMDSISCVTVVTTLYSASVVDRAKRVLLPRHPGYQWVSDVYHKTRPTLLV